MRQEERTILNEDEAKEFLKIYGIKTTILAVLFPLRINGIFNPEIKKLAEFL